VTVLEVIQRSTGFLARKGVESPRLQVELLLAHALGVPRLKLYLDFEQQLTPASVETVRELVRRRGNREPLQHIIGSTSFCGFEIKVNRHVLVPRPETEMLAERAWQFLAAVSHPRATALDFGTGSVEGSLLAAHGHAEVTCVRRAVIDWGTPNTLALTVKTFAQQGLRDVAHIGPGSVGTLWSIVAIVRSGRRTGRPARRSDSNACGLVTSWTRCRSI